MLVKRSACFETNSSSMHSIVVTKSQDIVTRDELNDRIDWSDETVVMYKGKMDMWRIDEGYGRYPFAILSTFREKLQYAMCEYMGDLWPDDPVFQTRYEEFVELCKKYIDGFEDFDIRKIEMDIYLDKYGNAILRKNLEYEGEDNAGNSMYSYLDKNNNRFIATLDKENYLEVPEIGSIDHQSAGMLSGFLDKNHIKLEDFLLQKKYLIIIDGDEYCTFDKLVKAGLINTENIVMEVPE